MKRPFLFFVAALLLAPLLAAAADTMVEADVCVYGGTSGGVVAAVQAARMRKRAVIVEPSGHLGGMTAGGLGAVDIGDPRTVGGISREYFTRLVATYGKTLEWDKPFAAKGGGPATGGAYSIEPHAAERVFNDMAREAKVAVHLRARMASIKKSQSRLTELVTEDGRVFRARIFIDATYEGDLMAKAGVSYTLDREGNAKYGETYNGIHYSEKYEPRTKHLKPGANGRVPGGQGVWDRDFPLDPYIVPGKAESGLLPLVSAGEPGVPGDPAPGIQAYCFRLCLTTSPDRLPIAPPTDYDPKRYELVARFIAACQAIGDDMDLRWFSKHDPLPNDKWDFNTATFGGNLPGVSWQWPMASYAQRDQIAKDHENYHRGLLHYLATDPRVPEKVRREMQRFGLPRDEFTDNGSWPHQLYIREARRMVSDLVLTEHHTFGRQIAPQSVSLGSYGTDTHEIRRIVKDGVVIREGKTATGRGGATPYPIGYGAIVPRQSECENLLVTFALSASHTAFSSIRMEPVFMATSQSAATAACLAIDESCPVQQVDYEKLKTRLLSDKQVLTWEQAQARAGGGPAKADEPQAKAAAPQIEPLVVVTDAPPVQMLLPGFAVRELPVELTNINNLRYRPDGQLYALGYNGDVWLLRDTDGDGLADSKSRFFENKGRLRGPIGLAVVPAGHALLNDEAGKPRPTARCVVVASKGKISALLDADGDDVAETERVIATGWKEIPQNVDAVGVAIHPDDGAIYFGLGTAAYNNAYLLDKEGKSAFDLGSERGTIQRIEPDLSRRTTVCTGVRFTCGMEFNADKQLIVTEQEGATWLPNGNPFDELLHIQLGRHYGFPPRHPRHLPNVFDEPSLFDYGPQHQSTTGMIFNLPLISGGPIFGPESWRGDAIVCGESRGKLYRTTLVRDQHGEYVARNQLIACLGMLTVDCCVTPRGDLLVACHSGGPDWGTGPAGIGKVFLIRYQGTQLPQPTTIWAAGPQEVRVAFDRPLDPQHLRSLATQSKITYGDYVAAGDRFETIRPGYAVTKLQQTKPRFNLPIHVASVTPDRQTLILATAPHPAAVGYALTLPGLGRESMTPKVGELPQHPQNDLAYSLSGVVMTWEPRDQTQPVRSGWLPNFVLADIPVQPGTLKLATQIDSRGLFLPVVQPGSQLDYDPRGDEWVKEGAIHLRSSRPFSVSVLDTGRRHVSAATGGEHQVSLPLERQRQTPLPIELLVETGGGPLAIRALWSATLADGRARSGTLALHRFLLPWASINPADSSQPAARAIPELAGANWERGRQLYLSDEAGCAKCHAADPQGQRIGPDLANLIHRDYASVLRDMTQPSYAINPDFITYVAALRDGRVLTGAVRSEGEQLHLGDKDGKVTTVARSEVEDLRPSPLSIMPDGIPAKLGPEKLRDLLAFLLQEPPPMPQDMPSPAPTPRAK